MGEGKHASAKCGLISMDAHVPGEDDLSDELRSLCTDFNAAEGDPDERARLLRHIRELRAMLAELALERAEG